MAGVLAIDDIYGTDIRFTQDGDLAVGPNGALLSIADAPNCVQALLLRVLTYTGELELHPEYGSDFEDLLIGDKNADPDATRATARFELMRILSEDERFASVDDIDATLDENDTKRVLVSAKLTLTGGEELVVDDIGEVRVSDIIDPSLVDDFDLEQDDLLAEEDMYGVVDDEFEDLEEIDEAEALAQDLDLPLTEDD